MMAPTMNVASVAMGTRFMFEGSRVLSPSFIKGLLALSLFAFTGSSVIAAGTTELFFEIQETYQDSLSVSGDEHGLITSVSPSISYSRQSRKSSIDIDYSLDAIFYHGLSDPDRENHNFNLLSQLTHEPEVWNTTIRGNVSRANTDADGLQITNPLLSSANTRELRTLGVTSFFQAKPTRETRFSLDAGANLAGFEDDESTEGVNVGFSVDNFNSQAKTNWHFSARSQQSSVGDNDQQVDNIGLQLGYRMSTKMEVFIDTSLTRTEFPDDESEAVLAGIEYRPNRSTYLRLGAGQRDNADSYELSLSRKLRHVRLTADYKEEIQSPRNLALENFVNPQEFQTSFLDLSIAPVLQKRTDIGLEVQGERSQFGLKLFHSLRESLGTNAVIDEEQYGFRINASRKLSRQSNLQASWTVQETSSTEENTLYDFNATYARQLARNLDFNIGAHSTLQKSSLITNEYKQYSLTFSLRKQF
jgi:hypothetical protein